MSEKICGIYKITNNINGRIYIGQSIDIYKRWKAHKHKKYSGDNDCAIYKAFHKYGLDNFSFNIVEECDPENLDDREIYYIEKYNSYLGGYNMTRGGNGLGFPLSEEIRRKTSRSKGGEEIIQLSLNGDYISEYFSISEVERALDIPHENIIKVLNGQYKSAGGYVFVKKSLYSSNKSYVCKRDKDIRPVKQYTLDGIFVREYENQIIASDATGICNVTISAVCRGDNIHKTAGGYQWVFSGDEYRIRKIIPHERSVLQFDKNNNFIREYERVRDAAKSIGVTDGCIIGCCSGIQKTSGGYIWKYKEYNGDVNFKETLEE